MAPIQDMAQHPSPFARIKGVHASAYDVLGTGLGRGLPVMDRRTAPTPDETQLDPTLDRGSAKRGKLDPQPQAGATYAGLTADQRAWFVEWLETPNVPTAPAYRKLYVAYLEVALFESSDFAEAARAQIQTLLQSPVWRDHHGLIRAWLLALWLTQDGPGLAEWLGTHPLNGDLLATALALQAEMGVALQPRQAALALADVVSVGGDGHPPTDIEVMKHRLGSLASDLGEEILAHALAQVDEADRAPQPWRCSHRDLRIALPQPPVMPHLRPLLQELAAMPLAESSAPADSSTGPIGMPGDEIDDEMDDDVDATTWTLILEFGTSRSQYFDYVLAQAQKQPGFTQIMDENRRMIYRVRFHKRHMKRFWRIWDYVRSWASTHVYLNGQEVENWKVWPHSQYLR